MEKKSTKNIRTAFLLNLSFSIIELIGGIYTNSIAITTDSLHDFSDSLSIAISWFLERKSEQKPSKTYTYGYARFSVLGALISTIFLLVSSVVIIYASIPRILRPQEVNYDGVLTLAVLGLFVNGLAVYKTAKGSSLNEKAINLHLLEDVFGWAAVLVIGILMKIFNLPILDPILSILITAFILFRVIKNLKAIFEVFLEKAPNDINIQELKEHLLKDKNIKDIHHVHLWTLGGVNKYITLHVTISDTSNKFMIIEMKNYIRRELHEHKISHSTIEFEFENEKCTTHECVAENNSNNHFGHNH